MAQVDDHLLIIGGGALCFSFGACFNGVIALALIRSDPHCVDSACPLDFRIADADQVDSNLIDQVPLKEATLPVPAAVATAAEPAASTVACQVCGAGFASRNKLNRHVAESGHRL